MMVNVREWGRVTRFRLLVALIALPLVGLLGVIAAEWVPDTRIANQLLLARESGVLGVRDWEPGPLGTTTVHHSECLALGLGLGDPPGMGPIGVAVQSPTYPACPRLDRQLTTFQETGELATGATYLRYWHGYSVLTRPALALFGVAGARWLAFGLLVLAIGTVYVDVRRRAGATAALLLVVPVLLTSDTVIGGLSIVVALGTLTAWLGGWLCFRLVERKPTWRVAAIAAALGGAANAYLDLMTTISGAFTMSVVGATLGAGVLAGRAGAARLRVPVAASVGWVGGMVWMWVSKWLLAMVFLGASAVTDDVLGQVFFRLSGSHEKVDPSRLAGFTKPLAFWWDRPLTPWVVLAVIATIVVVMLRPGPRSFDGRTVMSLLSVATIIVVPHALYYMVLNSHSQIHAGLVYRSLPIAFGGLAAWLLASLTSATAPSESVTSDLASTFSADKVRDHGAVP